MKRKSCRWQRSHVVTLDTVADCKGPHPPGEEATAWKLDFSPDGSEILTGSLSLRTLDVNLKPTKPDFNAPSKFIHSMTYGPEKHNIAACGNIDGVV